MHRTRTTAAALLAAAAVMPVLLPVAKAQSSSFAEREMTRRKQNIAQSDKLRDEGREAYKKNDFKQAVDKYTEALQLLPNAPAVQDRRDTLVQLLADGSVALGQQYRKVGKYAEAHALADTVLAADPGNPQAKVLTSYLDDPIRTNPALTAEHTQNVDEVRRGLYTAEGFYNLGKFDDAKRKYEDVLRIDPYNTAARRGMEQTAQARAEYYRAAYDQTRAELLAQVDAAWELSVPRVVTTGINITGNATTKTTGVTYILNKLKMIIIPTVQFDDTSVDEAIDFLRLRARELDVTELDPARKGINFVVRKPHAAAGADAGADAGGGLTGGGADPGALRIHSLNLRNVPLAEALRYICDATRLRYKVDDYAVTIVPATETDVDLFSRTFSVPPDFISAIGGGGGGGGEAAGGGDPFAPAAEGSGPRAIQGKPKILDVLKDKGIPFPDGASATLTGSSLVVRNTPANIDLIENLVDEANNKIPKQVKISTKFVEISQENTDELGFDWIVSPFGLSANSTFLSGGTVGSGQARSNADFISPIDGSPIAGVPTATATNATDIVTAGLRSGSGAISRNNIDAVLNSPTGTTQTASPAPGILALTGLFSDGQVQMIMRGLSQKKGTDLMTAPSVTARSGEKALIEIIREFIYPTEYEPPQLPNTVGGGVSGTSGAGSSGGIFPVTPATPTSFETKNTGVTLEIEPTIGNNNFTIDLTFAPNITEFEGFVNYGSPIQSPATDFLGNPTTVTITDNRIEMPVFSTRRVTTALTIFDGYTVAVGGLMREDVQQVDDKVPVLGDIPFIGRLFQSKAENRIKSNLIIFVTANIIDATGRPVNGVNAAPTATPTTPGAADPSLLPPPSGS